MAIKKCECENVYQDKQYGKGMRVMNPTSKKVGDRRIYRCTICKKEK